MAIGPLAPHLWFREGAVEATRLYADIFPDASVDHIGIIHDTPAGDCTFVHFTIAGQPFMAIDGGQYFPPKPSVSFIVNFDPAAGRTADELDAVWERLCDGGEVRMPLDEYPFAKRFGWVADKYGFDWQLMLTDPEGDPRPFIVPAMMFSDDNHGNAQEAIDHYIAAFGGQAGRKVPWPEGEGEGIMFADLRIADTWMAVTDDPVQHDLDFRQAISWLIPCDTQDEMDGLSDALSADPAAEQCGWITDRFGMPWQITGRRMQQMLRDGTPQQVDRVTQAFLPMKRLDIAALERAYATAT